MENCGAKKEVTKSGFWSSVLDSFLVFRNKVEEGYSGIPILSISDSLYLTRAVLK